MKFALILITFAAHKYWETKTIFFFFFYKDQTNSYSGLLLGDFRHFIECPLEFAPFVVDPPQSPVSWVIFFCLPTLQFLKMNVFCAVIFIMRMLHFIVKGYQPQRAPEKFNLNDPGFFFTYM